MTCAQRPNAPDISHMAGWLSSSTGTSSRATVAAEGAQNQGRSRPLTQRDLRNGSPPRARRAHPLRLRCWLVRLSLLVNSVIRRLRPHDFLQHSRSHNAPSAPLLRLCGTRTIPCGRHMDGSSADGLVEERFWSEEAMPRRSWKSTPFSQVNSVFC